MKPVLKIFLVTLTVGLGFFFQAEAQLAYRIFPYLQLGKDNVVQIRWFGDQSYPSSITIRDSKGNVIVTADVVGKKQENLYYTAAEKAQVIPGLEGENWIGPAQYFRYDFQFNAPPGDVITYQVTLNGQQFSSIFRSAPNLSDWQSIRMIAMSDSETEPEGRVNHRAWYPGVPLNRPFVIPSLWKQKFGTTIDQGFEIPNYFLSEKDGYAENLRIVNSRNPDLLLMPGDLVQSGGYMPAWDEFWRHNSGEFDFGLSSYHFIPALGNWESDGGINGGYGFNERGEFNPVLGRSRFHSFFEIDSQDPLQKHRQSYYRADYGPVTVLTLDSSNGTPEQTRGDTPPDQKLKNKEYSGPGTDTQENYSQATYEAAGGQDLTGFGPGSPQYIWLEQNLKDAKEKGQLIFVQYHHIAYSSGENGVPMNHELSTGQGGTPMRVLQPLLEENGVLAVFSGHDELFERSFVDEDGDGKGIHYFDVGVAGDGMRGVKRNWLSNPLAPLDYNSFSQWTADQKSPEQWNTSGANPVLIDGGKHYGHLEINVKKVKQGDKTFAQIDFEPVYAFPVMDQTYTLQRVERRVYNDPVRIMVELPIIQPTVVPEFKTSLKVELNAEGKLETKPSDYLVNEVQPDWTITFSRSTVFTCADLGVREMTVTVRNTQNQQWSGKVPVEVLDKTAPQFEASDAFLAFDKVIGKVTLVPEDFYIREESITENCLSNGGVTIEFDKKELTCSDLTGEPISVKITMTDRSGNSTSKTRKVTLNPIESKKIAVQPADSYQGLAGESVLIQLGEEFAYTVEAWVKDGQVIANQKGKTLMATQSGTYFARLIPTGGCLVESKTVTINLETKPFGPLKNPIELNLDASGKASLEPSAVFVTWPLADPNLIVNLSQSEFTCLDLGEKELTVIIKNQTGQTWEENTVVKVQDKLPPVFETKKPSLVFDRVKGVLELKPEDFVASLSDNCGIKSLTLNKNTITCADYELPVELVLTATDNSGNQRSESITLEVSAIESKKISITPSGEQEAFAGTPVTLSLGNEFGYVVQEWLRDGVKISGQTGKQLTVSQTGTYKARILPEGGCLVESLAVKVTFLDKPYSGVKALVELPLDGSGKATLKPENVFLSWPLADPNLEIKFSQAEFTCTDLGDKQVTLTIKNQSGQTWEEKTIVKVQDKIKPVLVPKNFATNFDVTKGVLELKPEDFIASLTDNCGIKEVTINKTTATCEDLGKETPVAIRVVDLAGNVAEATAILTLNRVENQKVTISGPAQLCQGEKGVLTLNSAASFEVIRWRRNGNEIPGQTSKTLEVSESGKYHAVIRYTGGCLSETEEFEVKLNPLPTGEITVDGNILRAPEGNFTYQWFRNGEKLNGATARTLTVDLMGDYQVELTSPSGCVAKLKTVTLTISGLGGKWVNKPIDLKLYPNPASDLVTMELPDGVLAGDPEISVYAAEGKNVSHAVQISRVNDQKLEIRVSSLASGTYLVWVIGPNQQTYFGKLVKLD